MLDTEKLRTLEELHRRKDALGPNATRDAVLGWVGTVLFGVLVYAYMTNGDDAARDARYAEQQAVREENARIGCASGIVAACEELR